jgi:hypothetical protein
MKLLTEYLEHALQFERLAAQESNPKLKAQFESQAGAYRKLAADRAERYGLPPPSPPQQPIENRGGTMAEASRGNASVQSTDRSERG